MLSIFRDYPAEVLSWNPFDDGNLSIHQAAQIIDKIFLTGVDHMTTLLSGAPDDVRSQIDGALREVPLGRMMIGPGCAAKAATPDDNLRAIGETAKGFKA